MIGVGPERPAGNGAPAAPLGCTGASRAAGQVPISPKPARRPAWTPRVAKPGGHTGFPPAHARPPYTAGSGEDEDQVRLRRQARTRPRDWRTSRFSEGMCTGSLGPRVVLPRPRPNLGGGPGGRSRPAGSLPGAAAGQAASYRPRGPAARPGASRYQVLTTIIALAHLTQVSAELKSRLTNATMPPGPG